MWKMGWAHEKIYVELFKGYKAPNSMILFAPLLDHNGLPNDI